MTRYVIDAHVAIKLAADRHAVPDEHELLAPTLLRSQVLSILHAAVGNGELSAAEAKDRLDYVTGMRLRLLGDRVLRDVAWKVADKLGWSETYDAEYVALTQLQADAFITVDKRLAEAVEGIVQTASIDVLYPGR
jgi:predicted nucleic acid-binding protein